VILALAARTASCRASFDFGGAAPEQSASCEPGMAGSNGVGIVEL
jgi:hypothetical protein